MPLLSAEDLVTGGGQANVMTNLHLGNAKC